MTLIRLLISLLTLTHATTADWPMPGANPQRASWCAEEVPGRLAPLWYRPLEPYISHKVQVIAAEDLFPTVIHLQRT